MYFSDIVYETNTTLQIFLWAYPCTIKWLTYWSSVDQGWCQRVGGAWGLKPLNIFASPHRDLNFHASSALHKIRDLYSFLTLFRRKYSSHCLQRFLDTTHCRHFYSSSPLAIFFWHHHCRLGHYPMFSYSGECRTKKRLSILPRSH